MKTLSPRITCFIIQLHMDPDKIGTGYATGLPHLHTRTRAESSSSPVDNYPHEQSLLYCP